MEKRLQNEISNEDKLAIINKYLSETVNIIDNQLNPIKEKNHIDDNNINKTSGNTPTNKEKNNVDNNLELKLNSLEKIHNSLNIESDLLLLTKNNIRERKTTFIEDISNILIQRNKLLNELLSLFFEKTKELIEKEKHFNNEKDNNKNSKYLSSMSSTSNLKDIQNENRSFSNKKNKNKEFKFYFYGRKYENMVNYDNNIRNRKKSKGKKNSQSKNKNANIKANTKTNINTNNNTNSNNSTKNLILSEKNTTLSDFNKSINNLNSNELTPFHTNYFNYTSLSSINNQKSFSPQAINKRKYIIRNLNSPFIENNDYKTKQGMNNKKKNNKNKNRSASVIKEFKQNYRLNDNKNLEIKRGNLDSLINWEKLNLDKLNEIGVNLLTNNNNYKM
jgi:hypothetical protein